MAHRTIPIAAAGSEPPAPVLDPELLGPPQLLAPLLADLDDLALGAFGPTVPRGAWLRGLRLQADEAELRLAPRLGGCAQNFVQAIFELLRSRLYDTDIYITSAPR